MNNTFLNTLVLMLFGSTNRQHEIAIMNLQKLPGKPAKIDKSASIFVISTRLYHIWLCIRYCSPFQPYFQRVGRYERKMHVAAGMRNVQLAIERSLCHLGILSVVRSCCCWWGKWQWDTTVTWKLFLWPNQPLTSLLLFTNLGGWCLKTGSWLALTWAQCLSEGNSHAWSL